MKWQGGEGNVLLYEFVRAGHELPFTAPNQFYEGKNKTVSSGFTGCYRILTRQIVIDGSKRYPCPYLRRLLRNELSRLLKGKYDYLRSAVDMNNEYDE